jgi:hypothetical protein
VKQRWPISAALTRAVNPTADSRRELARRIKDGNAIVKKMLAPPKIWVIGSEDELGACLSKLKNRS